MKQIKTTMKIAIIAMMGMSLGVKAQTFNEPIKVSSSGDAIATFQTTDNKWLYTNWKNSLGQRKAYMGFDGSLTNFILSLENGANKISFPNGDVGIGTTNPKHKLDINTGGGNLKTYTFGLEHTVNTTGGWARGFRLRNENDNKTAVFGSLNGNAYIAVGFDISEDATGYRNQKFTINRNGNAALKGKFEAKEIKVTNSPTADFVFDEDYNLPTLTSIEKHIKEKKHLPEIASAREMKQNGVNLGEFQIQLLQKIEELTLYTIEQEKKLKIQRESFEQQQEEITAHKNEIEKLKKQNFEIRNLVHKLLKVKN